MMEKRSNQAIIGMFIFLIGPLSGFAQTLPQPTRNVYRCVQNGKVLYADAPCPGAERLELQPTRGFNKQTGREIVGTDVRREKEKKQLAEAIQPLTGKNAEQYKVFERRFKLPPLAKRECERLDLELPKIEQQEASAKKENLKEIQQLLYVQRARYRELRC